jgi:hypothetical protein
MARKRSSDGIVGKLLDEFFNVSFVWELERFGGIQAEVRFEGVPMGEQSGL